MKSDATSNEQVRVSLRWRVTGVEFPPSINQWIIQRPVNKIRILEPKYAYICVIVCVRESEKNQNLDSESKTVPDHLTDADDEREREREREREKVTERRRG